MNDKTKKLIKLLIKVKDSKVNLTLSFTKSIGLKMGLKFNDNSKMSLDNETFSQFVLYTDIGFIIENASRMFGEEFDKEVVINLNGNGLFFLSQIKPSVYDDFWK